MAPLCADPRQIIIALDPSRREALLKLVQEISNYMISQWQTPQNQLGSIALEDDAGESKEGGRPGVPEGPIKKTADIAISKQAENVQRAALKYALEWRDEILSKLQEVVSVQDGPRIVTERRRRQERLQMSMADGGHAVDSAGVDIDNRDGIAALQALYMPLPTPLDTIPQQDREEALSCILVLLLSTGKYSAHSRILLLYLGSSLRLSQGFVNNEEAEVAESLLESTSGQGKEAMSAEAEAEKRRQENKTSRFWKVGLASVAGAAIIGVTGGLAAPLVAGALGGILGGVGLGGVASFLGIFWMNGALVGTLFGAYGAKMTGEMVDKYAKEVEDFRFLPLEESSDAPESKRGGRKQKRRLRVTVGISGWLTSEDDVTRPWSVLGSDSEVFALRYEMDAMLAFGKALHDFIQTMAWKTLTTEIIHRTVLTALWAALWPIQLFSVASNVDNPFNRATNRSQKAGQLLADALINKVQGERPVTLVGYSCGATAIHSCLQSLAERHAFGLVDAVVILGTPAPSDPGHWRAIHPVVSGKIVNVYSENDMVLGFVYRMHSLALGVAGLQAIDHVQGILNLDLSDRVSGHLRYSSLTGEILRRCGFDGVKAGGEIEKDEAIKLREQHARDQTVGEGPKPAEAVDPHASNETGKPPLPRRPTMDVESPPVATHHPAQTIPRRPLARREIPVDPPLIQRRAVPQSKQKDKTVLARPDSEDEGHIAMVDMDDEDDHDGMRTHQRRDIDYGDIGKNEHSSSRDKSEHRILGYHA